MKARIVADIDELLQRGDFVPMDGNKGVAMVCPGCGRISAPRANSTHKYDPNTKSVTPSIVHDPKFGGCGWHGYLTNGEFA